MLKIHDRARGGHFVNAYPIPGGARRQFSFADRGTAERFVTIAEYEGITAAVEAYDALRRRSTTRFDGGLSLGDYAKRYANTRDKAATRAQYANRAKYLAEFPRLEALPIDKVRADDLEAFLEWLRRQPGRDAPTLSPQSVYHVWSFTRSVLRRAVKQDVISTNPAEYVEDPPKAPIASARSQEISVVIDDEELGTILAHVASEESRVLLRLLYSSGLRYGEATALRWDDITMRDGEAVARLHVTKTWSADKSVPGSLVIGPPKNNRPRFVHVRREFVEAMRDLTPDEDGYIFPRYFVYAHDWRRAARAAVAAGEIRKAPRVHDLRHSRVTHLLSRGAQPKVVSEMMGHATVSFTLDRYAHAMTRDAEAAALL